MASPTPRAGCTPLHVLLVEDSEDDATLLLRELKRGGYEVTSERVETADAMREALARGGWDLILSDYSMPAFTALQALELFKLAGIDIPFLVVSGTIGEEAAVEALRRGAHDFHVKGRFGRLLPAIQRELRDAETRESLRSAERSFRLTEKRLRGLFDAAIFGVATKDVQGTYTQANDAFLDLLGYSRDDLHAGLLTSAQLTPPEWAEQDVRAREQLDALGVVPPEERELLAKDGRRVRVSLGRALIDGSQVIEYVADLAAQKRTEGALPRSQDNRRQARKDKESAGLPGGVRGPAPSALGGLSRYGLAVAAVALATIVKFAMGRWWVDADADTFFLAAVGVTAWRAGAPPAMLAIALSAAMQAYFFLAPFDSFAIASAQQAAEVGIWCVEAVFLVAVFGALERARKRYRLMFEASPLPMWVYDTRTLEILEANDAMVAQYGFSREELSRMRMNDLLPSEESMPMSNFGMRRHHRKDGAAFIVEGVGTSVKFDGRDASLIVVTDVTGRVRAEEARRRAESRFTRLAEANVIGIVAETLDGRILEVNDAVLTMVGCSREEILSGAVDWASLTPPDYLEATVRATKALQANGKSELQRTALRRRDGVLVPVDVGSAVLELTEGERVSFLLDMSDRVRAEETLRSTEERLRQSQKMDAVGRLAGGVAHDFNNILSVILGLAELMLGDMDASDPKRDDLGEILSAGRRAAELTSQLLTFSRQQIVQPQVLCVNDLLAETEKMLRRIVGEDIDLTLLTSATLSRTKVDPGSLEQVVMNLVVNARDAMPRGGKLTIETANVRLDDVYAREHVGASPGAHVMLAVTDSGIGMDKATQARVFEPFFTTKEMGKGTGLGLATVFGIVKQAGGSVWVCSEPGAGTTFKIYLPVVDSALDGARPTRTPVIPHGSERILLVEDEERVRAVARGILRRCGYEVVEAGTAQEALGLCEGGEQFDLLVTDVVMPEMSGPELARRLTRSRPSLKVLCMSGYTDDAVVHHGVLGSEMPFLQKPLTRESLARRVREVLDDAWGASRELSGGAVP